MQRDQSQICTALTALQTPLFAANWNVDFPYLLAVGGKDELQVIDTVQLAAVRERYRLPQ